ncbi:MAG: lytic murein transglycosylase B [Rhodanobacteraceae bacterium]
MAAYRLLVTAALVPVLMLAASSARVLAATSTTTGPAQISPAETAFAASLAREDGLSEREILRMLAEAEVQPGIIAAMMRPAEAKPWKDYRPIFVNDKRIADGIAFYRDNRALLERVSLEYGVAPQIIVAILGVETNYGRIVGSYRVLDALTTLAFHYPPRADFFRGELRELFLLGDHHLAYPIDELKGSYAGAMGWVQFMPSSIAKYARDEDGDGTIDLWNSLPDVVASVANYFHEFGWQDGTPVAVRAQPAQFGRRAIDPDGLEPVYPIEQMESWGYAPLARTDPGALTTLVTLDGEHGIEYWLTFRNFYVISRYNRSPLYSMAVWQLASAVARGVAEPDP